MKMSIGQTIEIIYPDKLGEITRGELKYWTYEMGVFGLLA